VSIRHLTEVTAAVSAARAENAAFELSGPPAGNPSQTPQISNVVVSDSIVASGTNGTYPTGGGTNNCSVLRGSLGPVDELRACWSGDSSFIGNLIVGYTGASSNWPTDNKFGPNWDTVDFVNYNDGANGDYHLAPTSIFKGTATDGTDPGANIDAVAAATEGVGK
jgi:hypothetical protein